MLVGQTNRRAFIAGLGSAAAWPVVARGQNSTPGKIWRVGYLSVLLHDQLHRCFVK